MQSLAFIFTNAVYEVVDWELIGFEINLSDLVSLFFLLLYLLFMIVMLLICLVHYIVLLLSLSVEMIIVGVSFVVRAVSRRMSVT